MVLFYLGKRLGQPLIGALLAGLWGLGVVIIVYWHSRRVNVFAGLAATLAVIELAVTIITRSPTWYLAAAAIDSGVLGGWYWRRSQTGRDMITCPGAPRRPT